MLNILKGEGEVQEWLIDRGHRLAYCTGHIRSEGASENSLNASRSIPTASGGMARGKTQEAPSSRGLW